MTTGCGVFWENGVHWAGHHDPVKRGQACRKMILSFCHLLRIPAAEPEGVNSWRKLMGPAVFERRQVVDTT